MVVVNRVTIRMEIRIWILRILNIQKIIPPEAANDDKNQNTSPYTTDH